MVAQLLSGSGLGHMDYDTKILPRTGGYGRYNRLVVVCSWFPTFAVSLNLISDVFYTRIPDSYHCRADPQLLPSAFLLSNLSSQRYLNLTVPRVDGAGLSRCQLFKYPSNWSELSENAPREKWNLVCSDYWKIPLQHICFMSGWIMGYVLLGTLSDCLSCLLGVAVCLSNSAVIFLLLRLFQGSALAGVFVSSYIMQMFHIHLLLLGEGRTIADRNHNKASSRTPAPHCPPRPVQPGGGASEEAGLELCDPLHRLMASMVGGFFGVFAEVLLPGAAAVCRDWPVLQAVATLPLLQLLSCWCCASMFPESPRWLLATNQISGAKRSLQDFTLRNGVCLQDDVYPGETLLAQIDSVSEERRPRYFTVLELRRTRVIWKNCLILSFTLLIGTGIQYCFTRNLHTYSTNFYFTYFVRVVMGALACVFICLSVDRLGRRGMLLLSAIVTGLSSLLLLALTQCTPHPPLCCSHTRLTCVCVCVCVCVCDRPAWCDGAGALRGGSALLAGPRHAQRLLRQRGDADGSSRRGPGPGAGGGLRGHGRLLSDGAPEQQRLLPAPGHLCLLRRPLRPLHHAAAREQAQVAPRLHQRGREPAPAPSFPRPTPQGQHPFAVHPGAPVRVQPR
ncbi:unnamed protein product [Tetraodon nigroviridis]|uniref:(spotted green pufferfish) hypothetical protein n=1 Tax=Tetraodon nigroviridis TaxID=99883 RepID=Q4SY32_TETNG|nr:unnamed protein product [Tetraodon nigroviridis]